MGNEKRIMVVGAGLAGSILANKLALSGKFKVDIIESRSHIGGNCYTKKHESTGVIEHIYGPHIFNTNTSSIYAFFNDLSPLKHYTHKVKANLGFRGIFDVPVNLHTINQFFQKNMGPNEAKKFIQSLALKIEKPQNFEEQALAMVGRDLYDNFFYGYTKKQWGVEPAELPASVISRLPLRFDYDTNYHKAIYTGIPEHNGYTPIFEKLLDHPNISVYLNTLFQREHKKNYDHIFYSGPIDAYFSFCEGRLGYRTVWWESSVHEGDFQGIAQMNFPTLDCNHTRVVEHKHFMPWQQFSRTLVSKEFSKETGESDEPYYPKRLSQDIEILRKYVELANRETGVTFMGRLGTYRYLDMWKVAEEALELASTTISNLERNTPPPAFSAPPL